MDSRWGITTTKNSEIFGESTCLKIAVAQICIIVILLVLIQPKFIKQTYNDHSHSQIDVVKIVFVTSSIVAATYYLPQYIRN